MTRKYISGFHKKERNIYQDDERISIIGSCSFQEELFFFFSFRQSYIYIFLGNKVIYACPLKKSYICMHFFVGLCGYATQTFMFLSPN